MTGPKGHREGSARRVTGADLSVERAIWRDAQNDHSHSSPLLIAGIDEVGRGALAGPVSVGVAVVGADVGEAPVGLTDSKLLRASAREALVGPIEEWALGVAVGHASPAEIDAIGIVAALRLAGRRALAELAERGIVPDVALLDGVHDWLSTPPPDLISTMREDGPTDEVRVPPVQTLRKGDQRCASIAAASVCAKVTRDAIIVAAEDPGYGFATHKGYGTADHKAAISRLGASAFHRRSWRLG